MNKVRLGALLMLASVVGAIAGGIAVAVLRGSAWAAGAVVLTAEGLFWVGVLLMGQATYRAAKARGWRSVPGQLWRLLRHGAPAAGRHGAPAAGRHGVPEAGRQGAPGSERR